MKSIEILRSYQLLRMSTKIKTTQRTKASFSKFYSDIRRRVEGTPVSTVDSCIDLTLRALPSLEKSSESNRVHRPGHGGRIDRRSKCAVGKVVLAVNLVNLVEREHEVALCKRCLAAERHQ